MVTSPISNDKDGFEWKWQNWTNYYSGAVHRSFKVQAKLKVHYSFLPTQHILETWSIKAYMLQVSNFYLLCYPNKVIMSRYPMIQTTKTYNGIGWTEPRAEDVLGRTIYFLHLCYTCCICIFNVWLFEKKLQALWTGGNICLDMLAAGDFKSKFLNDEHRIWIYFHLT